MIETALLPKCGFYTYVHRRVDDGKVFYVGKGKGSRANSIRSRNPYWRSTANKHGVRVELVARWGSELEAFEHEVFLIACFRDLNYPLCNLTDGGDGISGYRHSAETRAKHFGKPLTDEVRAKIGDANRGRVRSEDVRARISASLSGRTRPAEVGAKISAAKKGRTTISQEVRERISAALIGKKHSGAARENHLAALRDPVRCARHSAAMKGRPWSAARRAAQKSKDRT